MSLILRSLAVMLLLVASLPAMATDAIGVMPFTTTIDPGTADGLDIAATLPTEGIPGMLITDLVILLNEDPAFADCDATVVETLRRKDVVKEQKIQESGITEPTTGVAPGLREPTVLVNGVISATADGGLGWAINVTRPGGGSVISITGQGPVGDILDMTEPMARQILEELCAVAVRSRAMHITAGLNDLSVDQDVCDITKPFALQGQGASAGLTLAMSPADAQGSAGSYELSGTAGGVVWSGGGTYAIVAEGASGSITMEGSATITTPMGKFSDTTPISGTVSTVEDCG